MLTEHILSLLIAERDKLNRAIEALQGRAKRRGRPPKNAVASATPTVSPASAKRKRRKFTVAQRKKQAGRMKAFWAAKKEAAAASPAKKKAKAE